MSWIFVMKYWTELVERRMGSGFCLVTWLKTSRYWSFSHVKRSTFRQSQKRKKYSIVRFMCWNFIFRIKSSCYKYCNLQPCLSSTALRVICITQWNTWPHCWQVVIWQLYLAYWIFSMSSGEIYSLHTYELYCLFISRLSSRWFLPAVGKLTSENDSLLSSLKDNTIFPGQEYLKNVFLFRANMKVEQIMRLLKPIVYI